MNISTTFGATLLALAIATSCTTVAGETEVHGKVYLVGVAGGG